MRSQTALTHCAGRRVRIVTRLSAFLLPCIGMQILLNGIDDFAQKIDLASLACGIGQMHLKEHAVCQSNVPNRWTRIGLAGLPR
jgi:hypothetical protein